MRRATGERGARIANFISTFSIVLQWEEEEEGVGVMRAQSLSFGDASNGPVNILTAVLFAAAAAEDGRAANAHFGPLNDS